MVKLVKSTVFKFKIINLLNDIILIKLVDKKMSFFIWDLNIIFIELGKKDVFYIKLDDKKMPLLLKKIVFNPVS